ncbi:MAG: hypothetical protein U0939_19315 [Pirellulales bacterium]
MPLDAFWRLFWKEYRSQLHAWLAILIMAPLSQLGLYLLSFTMNDPPSLDSYLFISLAAAGMFMLGSGATLFATEKETGTFDFLRRLPTSPTQVFAAKLLLALFLGLALGAILSLASQLLIVQGRQEGSFLHYLAAASVTSLELFAWSVGFSLLIRHPLWAAVLGVLVPSALLGFVYPAIFNSDRVYDFLGTHLSYLAPRFLVALAVLAVDAWLVPYWFHDRPLNLPLLRSVSNWRSRRDDAAMAQTAGRPASGPFVAHVWLSLRQARWVAAGLALSMLALLLYSRTSISPNSLSLAISLWSFGAAISAGFATFGFDAFASQYRFLADQGIDARTLWTTRQLLWGGLYLTCIIAALCAAPRELAPGAFTSGFLLACVMLFAVAQLTSLFQRRFVIALVTATASLILIYLWVMPQIHVSAPNWIAWAPVPFLFYASRRRIQAWYDDRFTTRDRVWLAGLLAGPPLVLSLGLGLYRAVEIPDTDPGFSIVEFQRRSETGTHKLDHLHNVVPLRTETPLDDARRKIVHDAIDEMLPETAGPLWSPVAINEQLQELVPPHYSPVLNSLRFDLQSRAASLTPRQQWSELARLLQLTQRADEMASLATYRMSRLIEANLFQDVEQWAARADVTFDDLRAAVRDLETLEQSRRTSGDALQLSYLHCLRHLSGAAGPDEQPPLLRLRYSYAPFEFVRWAPTERVRTQRELNHASVAVLSDYAKFEEALAHNSLTPLSFYHPQQLTPWTYTTFSYPFDAVALQFKLEVIARVARLRAARIQLALAAYYRRESKLPESLDQLQGEFWTKTPLDPNANRPFGYLPHGLADPIDRHGAIQSLPAHTPLLWTIDSPYRAQILSSNADLTANELPLTTIYRIPGVEK